MLGHTVFLRFRADIVRPNVTDYALRKVFVESFVKMFYGVSQVTRSQRAVVLNPVGLTKFGTTRSVLFPHRPKVARYSRPLNQDVLNFIEHGFRVCFVQRLPASLPLDLLHHFGERVN